MIHLKKALEAAFENIFEEVLIIEESLDIPENSYDSERKQYKMPLFLLAVRKFALVHGYDKILGITNHDLYIEERDFVIGQAEFGSHAKAAVIAIQRLYPKFYKQAPNEQLFLVRVVTEGIHEMGHVLGLWHCDKDCVMVFSEDVFDIDKKPVSFCERCWAELKKNY